LPTFRQAAVEDLVSSKEQYDVVASLEVIEHVQNIDLFVNSLTELVKPGGCLFISSINKTLWSYLSTIVVAENWLQWCPPGTHDWNKYVDPIVLSHKLAIQGIQTREIKGFTFNPLSRDHWEFSDDISANYILFGTKAKEVQ